MSRASWSDVKFLRDRQRCLCMRAGAIGGDEESRTCCGIASNTLGPLSGGKNIRPAGTRVGFLAGLERVPCGSHILTETARVTDVWVVKGGTAADDSNRLCLNGHRDAKPPDHVSQRYLSCITITAGSGFGRVQRCIEDVFKANISTGEELEATLVTSYVWSYNQQLRSRGWAANLQAMMDCTTQPEAVH